MRINFLPTSLLTGIAFVALLSTAQAQNPGITPSGGSSTYPNVELSINNNTQQAISALSNTSNFNTLTFAGTN